MRCKSFGYESEKTARTLVLGSMPGEASLRAGQYYAHPANQFWKIICAAFGGGAGLSYPDRLTLLKRNKIALWDVLKRCDRKGSADSDIKQAISNDFAAFFRAHPRIERILFNGGYAEKYYKSRVLPDLPEKFAAIPRARLPSTSPAHATLHFEEKLRLWKRALRN